MLDFSSVDGNLTRVWNERAQCECGIRFPCVRIRRRRVQSEIAFMLGGDSAGRRIETRFIATDPNSIISFVLTLRFMRYMPTCSA